MKFLWRKCTSHFLSHLGSMIKAKKLKLPSMTILAEFMQKGKEEDSSCQEDQPIQEGKWLETLVQRHYAMASVGRLEEEGESFSFTVQITISVFWRPKVLLVGRCDPKMDLG